MPWTQRTIVLSPQPRGFQLITRCLCPAGAEGAERRAAPPVPAAHLGRPDDQRKRRSRRAAGPGKLAIGHRPRRFSPSAHVRRPGRHAGPRQIVAVGQFAFDPGPRWRALPGDLAGDLFVRTP